ncbi:RidA family protein [Pseudomonas luteola]|uniref:RidA family protein n=1 Tax=Pseudomonas luteola TaxID=47886 RepID=UPI00123B9019|nr:RidA family protein [Pseudomonas luteola]QEU26317.1 RidA family protein [Pseudomonas luteola]
MLRRDSVIGDYVGEAACDAFAMSHSVSVGDTTYFSGLAPLKEVDGELRLVGEDSIERQMEYMLDVLERSLKNLDMDRGNVACWTVYVTQSADFPKVLPLLRAWVGSQRPACTLVEVKGFLFPGQLLELTVIAAR